MAEMWGTVKNESLYYLKLKKSEQMGVSGSGV